MYVVCSSHHHDDTFELHSRNRPSAANTWCGYSCGLSPRVVKLSRHVFLLREAVGNMSSSLNWRVYKWRMSTMPRGFNATNHTMNPYCSLCYEACNARCLCMYFSIFCICFILCIFSDMGTHNFTNTRAPNVKSKNVTLDPFLFVCVSQMLKWFHRVPN